MKTVKEMLEEMGSLTGAETVMIELEIAGAIDAWTKTGNHILEWNGSALATSILFDEEMADAHHSAVTEIYESRQNRVWLFGDRVRILGKEDAVIVGDRGSDEVGPYYPVVLAIDKGTIQHHYTVEMS